jgi:hypothetical protein
MAQIFHQTNLFSTAHVCGFCFSALGRLRMPYQPSIARASRPFLRFRMVAPFQLARSMRMGAFLLFRGLDSEFDLHVQLCPVLAEMDQHFHEQ